MKYKDLLPELIRALEIVRDNPEHYVFDTSDWIYLRDDGACQVCAAGAWFIYKNLTGVFVEKRLAPGYCPKEIHEVLLAINSLRSSVTVGYLDMPEEKLREICELLNHYTRYYLRDLDGLILYCQGLIPIIGEYDIRTTTYHTDLTGLTPDNAEVITVQRKDSGGC